MKTSTPTASVATGAVPRLGPIDVLLLSTWSGLAAGELEVGARVISKAFSSTDRLYQMTRHFVWVVPMVDTLLFLGFGLLLATATGLWPRRAGWLSPRLILAWAVLPAFMIAGRGIYTEALLILALGFASVITPSFERNPARTRRRLASSLPMLVAAVVVQASLPIGGDWLKRSREESRPTPPPGSPNVLLIVLDTVRADHLSLYGYGRPTSPNLERWAERSIRFDQARSAAPWTLASHASLFTGRWPHELGVRWMHPMGSDFPTLAEYLGSLGYATAGFVGNTFYCAYDSGLDRGFTHYEDYPLEMVPAIRTAHLVDLWLKTLAPLDPSMPTPSPSLRPFTREDRKDARQVNRGFLNWLAARRQPDRPFFAFLNYVDAHAPYVLPPGTSYRFGAPVRMASELHFLLKGWFELDKSRLSPEAWGLARDSYDSCVAFLDERLGDLFEALERRGLLDRTIVIVTADHGEGLGEHGLFDHGESLYRTEIRVPLLIHLPSGRPPNPLVGGPVSLRNIPSTIADLVGAGRTSPFAGSPLVTSRHETPATATTTRRDDPVLSELASPNPGDPNQGRSPARHGPLVSLAEGDLVYIRNEGDGTEQLFDERNDPLELTSRVDLEPDRPALKRFREWLGTFKPERPLVRQHPVATRPGG